MVQRVGGLIQNGGLLTHAVKHLGGTRTEGNDVTLRLQLRGQEKIHRSEEWSERRREITGLFEDGIRSLHASIKKGGPAVKETM